MARARSALKGFLRDVETARLERGRNTLAAWLRAHHDELMAKLDGRPIDWDLYLAAFAKRGLKDADGNTPTRSTASKTWHRVRATITADRARKQARSVMPALAPGEIAAGVRSVVPYAATLTASLPDMPRPRMQLDIRPARPLVPTPPTVASIPDPSQPDTAASQADAETQIRRALGVLDASRTPMPRVVR